jgi:hypothetical protein
VGCAGEARMLGSAKKRRIRRPYDGGFFGGAAGGNGDSRAPDDGHSDGKSKGSVGGLGGTEPGWRGVDGGTALPRSGRTVGGVSEVGSVERDVPASCRHAAFRSRRHPRLAAEVARRETVRTPSNRASPSRPGGPIACPRAKPAPPQPARDRCRQIAVTSYRFDVRTAAGLAARHV